MVARHIENGHRPVCKRLNTADAFGNVAREHQQVGSRGRANESLERPLPSQKLQVKVAGKLDAHDNLRTQPAENPTSFRYCA